MAVNLTSLTTDLAVTEKYNELLGTLLCDTSVYIRTKETLTELVSAGDLKGADKAKVIAEVLSNLNNGLVNAAMQTALNWTSKEKEVELSKYELQVKLDELEQKILTEKEMTKKVKADVVALYSQTKAMYGTPTIDSNGFVTALGIDGKVYEEKELIKQQKLNQAAETEVLKHKLKETNAAIYKIVADTYANYGNMSWTLTENACNVTGSSVTTPLAIKQSEIAENQSKGYSYNAWGNAVNAASSVLGMGVSAEVFKFNPGSASSYLLNAVNVGLKNMLDTGAPGVTIGNPPTFTQAQ